MTTISPDFDTPGEWLSKCEWVHPKRYYKCPFCELTLAKETNQRLEAKLAALVEAIKKHRDNMWGSGEVQNDEDIELYTTRATIAAAKVTP